MSNPSFRIRVFGGLRVWRDDVEVDLGPPRQRVVLAELLAARGRPVSFDRLIEVLWTREPPTTAANQVHRLVGQLRRLFEPGLPVRASGRWLLASGSAYRLVVDDRASYDLARLDDLVERARVASTRDADESINLYLAALAIVLRPPFVDLDSTLLQRPEFVALERARIDLAVQVADFALQRGRAEDVVPAMQAIAEGAPLDERIQARLIRALTATGRRPEALIICDRVRRRLRVELGVDPGAEIRAAYQAAVADPHETADTLEAGSAAAVTGPAHRPAQLPSPVVGFVDRVELNDALAASLADLDRGEGTVITAVAGMGGIGKTALAVAWAHRIADRFPDGQLYLNLRGFDPDDRAVEPSEALYALLQGLDPSSLALPDEDIAARAARFRSAMAGRRMIVLLDNARDTSQVRPLLPATAGCLVIVTSRNRLTGLVAREGAHSIAMDRLSDEGGRELLARRLGTAHLAADPAAVNTVLAVCAGLPLALSIAAARAATAARASLTDIAHELADDNRLDALATGDVGDDIRSVFSWSLGTISPAARRLFMLLGVHPGPEISLECAASIANDDVSKTRVVARELASANLLTEITTDRYAMHDLLRDHAAELLTEDERHDEAERRLVEHCVHSVRAAYLLYGRPPVLELAAPDSGMHPERPADVSTAIAWYLKQRPVLDAVVHLAMTRSWYRDAALIYLDGRPMSEAVSTPSELLDAAVRILDVIQKIDEPILAAEIHRSVAAKYDRRGEFAKADHHYDLALALFRDAGDLAGEAHTLRNRGNGIMSGRDPDNLMRYFLLASEVAQRADRADVLAVVLTDRIGVLGYLGKWDETIAESPRALDYSRAAGVTYMEATGLARLADAHLQLGEYPQAAENAELCLQSLEGNADVDTEIEALSILARAAFHTGDHARASDACLRFYALRDSFANSMARGGYTAALGATMDAVQHGLNADPRQ